MSADGEQGGVLLPCPFCGVSGIVFDDDKHLGWMAMCGKDCEMLPQTAWKTTKREAIDLWNTRAASATDTPEVVMKAVDLAYDLLMEVEQTRNNVWWVNVDDPEVAVCDILDALEEARFAIALSKDPAA